MVKISVFGEILTLKLTCLNHIFESMNTKLYILPFLILSLVACESDFNSRNDKKIAQKKMPIVKVETIVAKNSNVGSSLRYAGSVAEVATTMVSFSSPGTVKSVRVTEGKKVNKGALVATLDDTSAKSALEIASALKNQAGDARARMEKLHENQNAENANEILNSMNKSIITIQAATMEAEQTNLDQVEKLAQKALDDCKLYAPATGIVVGKSLEIGQNVVPSSPVFRIVNIATVKAVASVPEKDVAMLNVGDKVEVRVGALGDKTFEGKITNKGISANPLSRSYQIEAELKNKSGELLPGMLLEMFIDSKNSLAGVELPASAVLLDEYNRSFVWVVRDGKTTRKNVETSLGNGSQLLVQGIDDGDSVVVKGMSKVGEGDRVQTVNQAIVR